VNPEEGLPKWEPLTPELVEEEAIRGDYFIKWAVVLLAFLLASTFVSESTTLLHVKTGEYIASHGGLPPRTDVFSSTAAGRSWINCEWLFDLIDAGVYQAGGWIGLSVFKACLAAIVFWLLSQIQRPRMPTWWGSICAVAALLACQPRFTAQPELITLLGLALTFWILHRWGQGTSPRAVWMLVPLFLLWANLDQRMFLGLGLIVLYALGETIGQRVGRAFDHQGDMKLLWQAVAVSILVTLINPFGWYAWGEEWTLYRVIYPALRDYAGLNPTGLNLQAFPVFSSEFLQAATYADWLAVIMFVVAAITMALNFGRLGFGHLLVLIGFGAVGLLAEHELAAAALVFAALATLNGEAWFAGRYRLEYSVKFWPLMLTRGGRVVTVLGLFLVALGAITGRLEAPGHSPLGFGLSPELSYILDSYAQQTKETYDDTHNFHFVLSQGDYLIWVGRKSFVDHRVDVFSTGGEDILAEHRLLRTALRPKMEGNEGPKAGDDKYWQERFKAYHITGVLPRLSGLQPDYISLFALLQNRHFELLSIGSATALFYRQDLDDPELAKFRESHRVDFLKEAFRTEAERLPGGHRAWPQLPTFYERYIWRGRPHINPHVRDAQHLLAIGTQLVHVDMVTLAIRKAQRGLSEESSQPHAYALLGEAYKVLTFIEQRRLGSMPDSTLARLRYYQALAALNQALIGLPDDLELHMRLADVYSMGGAFDLVVREQSAANRIIEKEIKNPTLQQLKLFESNSQFIRRVEEQIAKVRNQVDKLVNEDKRPDMGIVHYRQNGCPQHALELLEKTSQDEKYAQAFLTDPGVQFLKIMLQFEVGRIEEAYEGAHVLQLTSAQTNFGNWYEPRRLTLLANGEYDLATNLYDEQAQASVGGGFMGLLDSLAGRGPFPIGELQAATTMASAVLPQSSSLHAVGGVIRAEAGERKKAIEDLRRALVLNPESNERFLIVNYLYFLTGEMLDVFPPSQRVPILFEEGPEEKPTPF
jgi:tetratricopeptide (TPR) repeat protein